MASRTSERWHLLSALALAVAPGVATATPVSLHFQGSVTGLDATQAPLLVPAVAIGDSISAVITFDDAAVGSGVGVVSYISTGAPFGIEAQIGSLVFASVAELSISVSDDWALPPAGFVTDVYQAGAAVETPALVENASLSIAASDDTASALSSAALPLDAAALAGFPSFGFVYQIPGSGGPLPTPITVIQGSLSIVPEPTPPMLLLGALLAVAVAARGRSGHALDQLAAAGGAGSPSRTHTSAMGSSQWRSQ